MLPSLTSSIYSSETQVKLELCLPTLLANPWKSPCLLFVVGYPLVNIQTTMDHIFLWVNKLNG